MNHRITLLFLFVFSISFAQIQKIQEFSQGNYVDSRIIYEENNQDVFGYFLLYEFDRKSREIYDMEYAVLDKNLNRITSGTFTQGVYKNFLIKTGARLTFVKKIKNELFFGLHDNLDNSLSVNTKVESDYFHERYRKINLEDFTISNEFIFQNSKKSENTFKPGDSFSFSDIKDNQTIYPINSGNFMIFAPSTYSVPAVQFGNTDYFSKIKKGINSFSIMDSNFKTLWTREINPDPKDAGYYRYRTSDQNILVMQKRIYNKKVDELNSFELYEIASGNFIAEITQEDPTYRMSIFKMEISGDNLIIYNYLNERRDKKYEHEKTVGYAKLIFNKNTGKELRREYMLWEDLSPHINFKGKFGEVPKYGKIQFQDFIHLKNGNTIGIAEGYKKERFSKILDFYLMEFDPQMKIKYFQKIEKIPNISKYDLSGQQLYYRRDFDYYYSQKLDEDGNYVILYANNEKEGGRIKRKKDPTWVLGIVTYVDGEFEFNKLQLTTTDGMIVPIKAKNGSILLQEYSEKNGLEMRLERINY